MVAPSAWASHILVNSKSEAIQIRDKVGKLKDFQKMARKKSTCPSSQKGGDLGWFLPEDMVIEFSTACQSIPKGEMGLHPIVTEFGVHIIYRTG